VREAVLAAALDLLGETGALPKVIDVAKRAGVQKSSIYRRWGSIEGLVLDAALNRMQHEIPIPDTGSWREDLAELVREGIAFHRSPFGAMMARLIVQAPESLRRAYWKARFGQSATIIARAQERGEISSAVDAPLVIEMLVAPLYLRSLVTGEPLDDDFAERLVDLVTRAVSK
jgi:AcrR family transcriptional regulator